MRGLMVVLTVGCTTASVPTPQNIARDTTAVEQPRDPPTSDGVTSEAQPTRFSIVDVDTGRPISDAVMNVDGADVISDAAGVVDVTLPFAMPSSATVRHPNYLPFKGPVTEQPMTIALQARSAQTFTTITATGATQTARLGNVTLTIPPGALQRGTRLELGLHDERTVPQPQYPTEPAIEMVPIPIAQLSVDVVGHDSRRYAHVVAPGTPVRVKWKLDAAQFLLFSNLGPAVTLSAGTSAERFGVDSLQLDANTNEVSFDLTHFSDVTLTQKSDITKDCSGQPVALHWWRIERKPAYATTRGPFPNSVGCAETERPLSVTGSYSETMTAQGTFATNWKIGAKADAGTSQGGSAKIFGNGVDFSWGPTFGWVYDYTRTHTGGFSVQASRKLTVTRSKMCPARTSCVGGLYIVMENEDVSVIHKWVRIEDVAKDPSFNPKITFKPGTEAKTCDKVMSKKAFDKKAFQIAATELGELAKKLEVDPTHVIKDNVVIQHTHTEQFSWSAERFVGATMSIKMVPPTCPPGHGEPVEVPPFKESSCRIAHARRPPAVVTPPGAAQDGLVDKEGAVVVENEVTIADTSLKVKITAGKTEAKPLQEVAHVIACCSDEEAKATFASDVFATISGAEQGAHSIGLSMGLKFSAGADMGLDIGLAEAKAKGKVDLALQASLTNAWLAMLQQGFGKGRSSAREVTAKATKTDCASKGVFAYPYSTEYSIQTVIHGSAYDSDKTMTVVLLLYGTPVEGQDTVFKNHCDGGGTHIPNETPPTDVPVAPPDPKKPNDKHSSLTVPNNNNYCAAVGLGQLGGLGDTYGAGELALYADACAKVTDNVTAVVTPTWYHGPVNETFTFAAGGEVTFPVGPQAPHVSLFARLQAGYARSTAFPGATSGTNAAVIVPEAGARYTSGQRFIGITPLSLPLFVGSETNAFYRLSVSAGVNL